MNLNLILGIVLLVASVFLVVAVLMQSGKSHNISGTIAGGAESFFGKTKGKTIDKILSKVTTVVAILFVLLVVIVYVIQPETTTTTGEEEDATITTVAETEADAESEVAEIAETAEAAADTAA